jgi:hypothetical protein
VAKLEKLRADAHRKATSDQIFTNENAGARRYFVATLGAGCPGSPNVPKSSLSERVDLQLSIFFRLRPALALRLRRRFQVWREFDAMVAFNYQG